MSRTARSTVGVGTIALVLGAAAAAPAYASGHGQGQTHGQSQAAHGKSTHETKTSHQGTQSQASSAQSNDSSSSSDSSATTDSGHNPPGNNGTVFIHDVAGDMTPHNVPHVGCNFYVDFFNFDAGQQATVSFAGQAPTGKDMPLGGTWSGTVSDDDASGAGNDFDLELAFSDTQLGVTNLGDPTHQGYHIKMTVVTNQPGDHKYKVFWMQPCTTAGATTTGQTGETGQPGQSNGAAGALQVTKTHRNTSSIPTEVLGLSVKRSNTPTAVSPTGVTPSSVSPPAASLPFTGAEIGGLAAAAATAIGGGAALLMIGRRRRNAPKLNAS